MSLFQFIAQACQSLAATVAPSITAMGNRELATYDPRRLTGVSVYQEIERELSVGERIQFTAPDKSLGVANRDMAAIEAIHPDGRLSVRLDNNRQIEFNPDEHRHLDHGYAVTSHSCQGLTAERVLVHADRRGLPAQPAVRRPDKDYGYGQVRSSSHHQAQPAVSPNSAY
jgi:hypothetical protein